MNLKKHLPVSIILLLVLISGMFTYKTYGTYWDEYLQRDMGKMSYNYVFNDDDALKTFMDKDLNTNSSVNEENSLLLDKKYTQVQIENTIAKYVKKFVICHIKYIHPLQKMGNFP